MGRKGTELVGRDGISSLGKRLAVETVTKEEKQEYRKTWRWERVKLGITCWTGLVFPVKWDVRSAAEIEVGGLGVKMIYYGLRQWLTVWLCIKEDDTFSKLAFGNPQIKLPSDKDRIALLVPITIKHTYQITQLFTSYGTVSHLFCGLNFDSHIWNTTCRWLLPWYFIVILMISLLSMAINMHFLTVREKRIPKRLGGNSNAVGDAEGSEPCKSSWKTLHSCCKFIDVLKWCQTSRWKQPDGCLEFYRQLKWSKPTKNVSPPFQQLKKYICIYELLKCKAFFSVKYKNTRFFWVSPAHFALFCVLLKEKLDSGQKACPLY